MYFACEFEIGFHELGFQRLNIRNDFKLGWYELGTFQVKYMPRGWRLLAQAIDQILEVVIMGKALGSNALRTIQLARYFL